MLRYLARRAGQGLFLIVLLSIVVFALIHAVPGGPLTVYLENPNVRPEDVERLKRVMGLDRPLAAQYASWMWAFLRGDWGYSYADGRPVLQRILERVPATLELTGVATLLAATSALIVGLVSSVRARFDDIASAGAVAGISLPVFWFGLVLQLVFANALGWLPSSGRASFTGGGVGDLVAHLVLPALVLAGSLAAGWSRYLRGSMREALAMPFVRGARARGIGEGRIVLRHALGNALLPFVTVVLLDASIMASGAVVTESVFAWPGIGSLFTEALAKRDYTLLMGFLMSTSLAVVLLNVIADLTVYALDPRTRQDA